MTSTDQIVEGLKTMLASSYSLMIKSQNYHWNVTGPDFLTYHPLFQKHYEDLFDAVDAIAERIKMLGYYAPGSLTDFSDLSFVKDATEQKLSIDMIGDLYTDHSAMVDYIGQFLSFMKNATSDEGTISLLGSRLAVHEKTVWFLENIITEETEETYTEEVQAESPAEVPVETTEEMEAVKPGAEEEKKEK